MDTEKGLEKTGTMHVGQDLFERLVAVFGYGTGQAMQIFAPEKT